MTRRATAGWSSAFGCRRRSEACFEGAKLIGLQETFLRETCVGEVQLHRRFSSTIVACFACMFRPLDTGRFAVMLRRSVNGVFPEAAVIGHTLAGYKLN
jgi:hypothetical protein